MLKRLIKSLTQPFTSNKPFYPDKAVVVPRDEHIVSRRKISRSAIKVMSILQDAGYDGYLVGGGVRDTLLGGHPKDFDVATNATPEQVKRLFRNGRIIGRRFKIVHVTFGREIIEVTTFRANHDDSNSSVQSKQSSEGMLLRDNVYGDLRSDALRRDFTINALYYSLDGFTIHDFTNGMGDIKARKVRMIGDPKTRYQEDPVRLLRAVRFAAKLNFEIEADTAAPITSQGPLLRNISSSRLFDECLKLFLSGHAKQVLGLLQEYQLLDHLFPATVKRLQQEGVTDQALLNRVMENTDKRLNNDQKVTPAFILAALLWGPLQHRIAATKGQLPPAITHQKAAQYVIDQQQAHTSIPKRFLVTMREIWDLQGRLVSRHGNRAESLHSHARFRAAYDFVLLREQAGEDLKGLGEWWTRYQDVDEEERLQMVKKLPSGPRKPRRRRKKKPE